MAADKKLGLERLEVAVAMKFMNLPALICICQMQRVDIILHVKRVSLKHVIVSKHRKGVSQLSVLVSSRK